MSGHVVCLEDRPTSIQDHVDVIEKYDLDARVCERPIALGDLLPNLKRDKIKAFILDMHDRNVADLGELDLKHVGTQGGLAVGLAVAEGYLRAPDSEFRNIPLGFLTGYKIADDVGRRIEVLKKQGLGEVRTFSKTTDLPAFEEFIRGLAPLRDPRPPGKFLDRDTPAQDDVEPALYRESVRRTGRRQLDSGDEADLRTDEYLNLFIRIGSYLGFEEREFPLLLGMTTGQLAAAVPAFIEASSDAKVRIKLLLGIANLISMFISEQGIAGYVRNKKIDNVRTIREVLLQGAVFDIIDIRTMLEEKTGGPA